MEAFRQKQVLCRTTLAPTVAKDKNMRTLRAFHAPARGNEQEGDTASDKHHQSGILKQQVPCVTYFNPLQLIQKMTSETLTDADAERVVYPFHASAITTPFEQVLVALVDKLRSTVDAVSWNKPQQHAEWYTDLRFFEQWWLVLRSQEATSTVQASADLHPSGRRSSISWVQDMHSEPLVPISTSMLLRMFHEDKDENRYTPLLPRDAGTAEENQLIADLARRLSGPTGHLHVFHLSGLHMTPDRLHVLFFDGFSRLSTLVLQKVAKEEEGEQGTSATSTRRINRSCTVGPATAADNERTLSTLSFSSCQISSGGLVVLLTGLAALAAQGMDNICTLDLSYNALQSSSLYSFTQLLRFTFIKRLSLRGNNLASADAIPFREFLLEGCDRQMEELDLSYTELSAAQLGALIEALPRLNHLRVLLLEEVTIPASKWPSLALAVRCTQLCYMRLELTNSLSIAASSVAAYMKSIDEVCARNVLRAAETGGAAATSATHTGFFGFSTSSFFEAFFRFSQLRVASIGDKVSALPGNYGAFTSNDPSLL